MCYLPKYILVLGSGKNVTPTHSIFSKSNCLLSGKIFILSLCDNLDMNY